MGRLGFTETSPALILRRGWAAKRIARGDETLKPEMEIAGFLAEIRKLMRITEIWESLALGRGGLRITAGIIMGIANPHVLKMRVILGYTTWESFQMKVSPGAGFNKNFMQKGPNSVGQEGMKGSPRFFFTGPLIFDVEKKM